jgi:p-methyltransferase
VFVIGYNELPFERYENFLRNYGEDSEAYRDLKFSFVNLGGRKLDYRDCLNYAREQSHPHGRTTESDVQVWRSFLTWPLST